MEKHAYIKEILPGEYQIDVLEHKLTRRQDTQYKYLISTLDTMYQRERRKYLFRRSHTHGSISYLMDKKNLIKKDLLTALFLHGITFQEDGHGIHFMF